VLRALRRLVTDYAETMPAQTTPRDRLRAAQVAVKEAEQVLADRKADTERVRRLIASAAAAEDAQKCAEEAVRSATRKWAEGGAPAPLPPNIKALQAAVTAARNHAYETRLLADGLAASLTAARDLPGLARDPTTRLPVHAEALTELYDAKQELARSVGAVLDAAIVPELERALALRAELDRILPGLAAHVIAFGSNRVKADGCGASFKEGLSTLLEPPKVARILESFWAGRENWRLPELEPWIRFGEALQRDPEAEFTSIHPDAGRPA
jgi:hypothetical protein